MNTAGIQPDVYTLCILIHCCCQLNPVDYGFCLLGDFVKRGYDPNVVTYTTLIKGLCMQERVGPALELFEKMIEQGIRPNAVTFNTLICGFCRNGERMMGKWNCTPNVITYTSLIHGFCNSGKLNQAIGLSCRLDEAIQLFYEMEQNGIKANQVTYNTLIAGLCRVGKVSTAGCLFVHLQMASENGEEEGGLGIKRLEVNSEEDWEKFMCAKFMTDKETVELLLCLCNFSGIIWKCLGAASVTMMELWFLRNRIVFENAVPDVTKFKKRVMKFTGDCNIRMKGNMWDTGCDHQVLRNFDSEKRIVRTRQMKFKFWFVVMVVLVGGQALLYTSWLKLAIIYASEWAVVEVVRNLLIYSDSKISFVHSYRETNFPADKSK
ncbi:hypothetical protein C5167_042524 [Papaver somniferum]|uniref:Pentatricopeptide repeat-containing protein n=1 Tax=Papaver somniferum TaxID=3469 RepID=A0A4Y7L689_PAPSO|nr:hypothetical protein C5167_042524 [Papaver somniferum]